MAFRHRITKSPIYLEVKHEGLVQSDLNLGPEPTNHLTPPLSPPHLSPPLSPLPGSTLKNCVDGGRGLMTARCVQAIMCAHNVQVAIMGGCSEVITPDQLMITRSPGQGGRGQNFTTHCGPLPASSCIIGQTIRHRGEHNHPLRRCITALSISGSVSPIWISGHLALIFLV